MDIDIQKFFIIYARWQLITSFLESFEHGTNEMVFRVNGLVWTETLK